MNQLLLAQLSSKERRLVQKIGRVVRADYDNMDEVRLVVILVAAETADEDWYKKAIVNFDSKRITETYIKIPETW